MIGPEIKPVYTLCEFARMTGMPSSTVYAQAKRGALQTIQVGGRPMVPLTAVLPFWESLRLATALRAVA